MTEEGWLQGDDDRAMMYFLKDTAGPRKLRLFACACCRRVKWYDPSVLEMIEDYADGRVRRKEAMSAVKAAIPEGRINAYCSYLFWKVHCHYGADSAGAFAANGAVTSHGLEESAENFRAEERLHADLIRCIFGNPFQPVSLDPAAVTPTLTHLARAAYEERLMPSGELDPQRLAVLADALEESGAPGEMASHLRSPGRHVRGCWALDLLLGKGHA